MEHSGRTSQSFRVQRMGLREFSEFVQGCIDPIVSASQTFDTIEEVLPIKTNHRFVKLESVTISLNIIEEYCSLLHNNTEFSMCLPLAAMPFLLPLLVVLKKALSQIKSIKLVIESNQYIQPNDIENIIHELLILKDICDRAVRESCFLLQRARFQEKALG